MSWTETGISRLRLFIYDDDGEEVYIKTKIKYSYTPGMRDLEYDFEYEILFIDAPDWVGENEIRQELDQWSIYDIMNSEDYNSY